MAASTVADLIDNRYGHLPWRQRVITYSTASTATYELATQESGAIFYVPEVSTAHFSLPRISSNRLGLTYEFMVTKQGAEQDVQIASTIDSSAQIVGIGTTGSTASTASAVTPLSTVNSHYYTKVVAASSIVWILQTNSQAESSGAETLGALSIGGWQVGTTIA